MLSATANFHTEHGSRYLQQLCKHFAHKIDVTFDERHGECRFSCGTAVLDADADVLRIRTIAPDAAQLEETRDVIESHLMRFAFREPAVLEWVSTNPPAHEAGTS